MWEMMYYADMQLSVSFFVFVVVFFPMENLHDNDDNELYARV